MYFKDLPVDQIYDSNNQFLLFFDEHLAKFEVKKSIFIS